MQDHEIEEMLWRALEAPRGVEIECSDIEALKRRLYQVRGKAREKGNAAFDDLAFVTPPAGADVRLWIVNNSKGAIAP